MSRTDGHAAPPALALARELQKLLCTSRSVDDTRLRLTKLSCLWRHDVCDTPLSDQEAEYAPSGEVQGGLVSRLVQARFFSSHIL